MADLSQPTCQIYSQEAKANTPHKFSIGKTDLKGVVLESSFKPNYVCPSDKPFFDAQDNTQYGYSDHSNASPPPQKLVRSGKNMILFKF